MQGKYINQKNNDSGVLSFILFIVLIFLVYLLSVITIDLWPYGFIGRSLFMGLVIILLLRSIPKFINPNLKITLFIFFWSGAITLVIHLVFMDKPEIIQFLSTIQDHFGLKSLLICTLIYLILLSVPFVPGVEIGLFIMAVFGKDGVVSVYLATIGGLSLSYFFGHYFPQLWEKTGFQKLDPTIFITKDEKPLPKSKASFPQALKSLISTTPWLIRYRYLFLALLINLPGNAIIGGGGGISFISGVSKQFKWFWFTCTLILATLPIPLFIYFGLMEVEKLIQ